MTINDIDPPGAEPVALAYAKTFLRVDHTDEDALITDLIVSARERVETLIRGSLITRRRLYVTEHFERASLRVNHSPISSVERVAVIGADRAITDVPLEDLEINLRATPASLCLKDGKHWTHFAPEPVAIEIDLTAGYGTSESDVPMPLRQAILLLLAQSYEHRGEDHPGLPFMVDALTMPYRGLRL